jgi:hypothetical protein
MKTMTTEFPKFTSVIIIDTDDGYFIQRKNSGEELDIRFNTPKEAIDYAIANHLIIITDVIDA